jgi:DNA adenine methylase
LRPILKWAGGKRGLVQHILRLFPPDHRERNYHEPFVGGGAVFFTVGPTSGTVNDVNPHLINFYRIVRDRPDELIAQASRYSYDKDMYYELRDRFNQASVPDVERAALLLYLNKTAYNGLYRVNSKGQFNVPFGRYRNPTIVSEPSIRAASRVLKRVEIFNADFSYVLDVARRGDLCYIDPPYQPSSESANFTSYSPGGFGIDEQRRLRDVCLKLDEGGVLFVLSNSHTEPIVDLYREIDAFRIETIQAKRAISANATTRRPVAEILVTNISQ